MTREIHPDKHTKRKRQFVERNSCQSRRPIFYFVLEEAQRHWCHKPKTRYVIADYGIKFAVFRIKTIYRKLSPGEIY